MNDDFEKAENTFEIDLASKTNDKTQTQDRNKKGKVDYRQKLLKEYYDGENSLTDKLKNEGKNTLEELAYALLDEMIKETDNLKGNELIATEAGATRDATIISDKRLSGLAQVVKAIQTKQEFDKEKGGFDINSPSMRVILSYFMEKAKDAFKVFNYGDEQSDIFFRHLGLSMNDWKKDLKLRLEEINMGQELKNVKKY